MSWNHFFRLCGKKQRRLGEIRRIAVEVPHVQPLALAAHLLAPVPQELHVPLVPVRLLAHGRGPHHAHLHVQVVRQGDIGRQHVPFVGQHAHALVRPPLGDLGGELHAVAEQQVRVLAEAAALGLELWFAQIAVTQPLVVPQVGRLERDPLGSRMAVFAEPAALAVVDILRHLHASREHAGLRVAGEHRVASAVLRNDRGPVGVVTEELLAEEPVRVVDAGEASARAGAGAFARHPHEGRSDQSMSRTRNRGKGNRGRVPACSRPAP